MASLMNKVVIITGASTGIGAFTAQYLSQYKPKVVLVARSESKLRNVQKLCEDAGAGTGNVLSVVADLAQPEAVEKVVKETISTYGQLDVLVNNAYAGALYDVEHTTPESFDRVLAVNIRAPFFLSQAAMPHLKKTSGVIINISSVAGRLAICNMASYAISKAALEHFTRVLAFELAASKVRVNAITLGVVMTNTREELEKFFPKDQKDVEHALAQSLRRQPLGGDCSMEDVAKVVTFLVSDQSAAMTGACLPLDRGLLVVPPDFGLPGEYLNTGDINALPAEVIMQNLFSSVAKSTDSTPL